MAKFKRGDKVTDLDGRYWVVNEVKHFNGAHWYEVRRYEYGKCYDTVRYESDLVIA